MRNINQQWKKNTHTFPGQQQSFEEAESKKKEAEEEEGKPDQLTQLVTTFSHKATTEHTGVLAEDPLYMSYAEIMGWCKAVLAFLFLSFSCSY